jgi:hypothetical protein
MAESKNVIMLSNTSSFDFERVCIKFVIRLNPLWESITSTMVIAPNRKNMILEIDPKCRRSSCSGICIELDERK